MFFKDVWKSIFDYPSDKHFVKKSTSSATVYLIVSAMMFSCLFSVGMYFKYLGKNQEIINQVYESIPNFTVSQEGFDINSNETIEFSFAGVNMVLDDNVNYEDIVLDKGFDNTGNTFMIGKNGYAELKDKVVVNAGYFADMSLLDGVVIDKDDLTMVETIIEMIFTQSFAIRCAIFAVGYFVLVTAIVVFTFVISLILSRFRRTNIDNMSLLRFSCYEGTFFELFFGVAILSEIWTLKIRVLVVVGMYILHVIIANKKNGEVWSCEESK